MRLNRLDAAATAHVLRADRSYVRRMAQILRILLRQGDVRNLRGSLKTFLFCYQRVAVLAVDLTPDYHAPSLGPHIEIRQARLEDMARLRALPEGNRIEFYRDAIEGAEPWVALWDGHPAHIAWVYDSTLRTRFVRLKKREAELRFGYTLTDFRGRGLYGLTNAVMAADLARRSYIRAYGYIIEDSPAFRLGLELAVRRFGFRHVRTVRHLRMLGMQLLPHLSL